MSFLSRVSQQTSIVIIAAFLVATAVTTGVSLTLSKQAHALSSVVDDTIAPTAPGVPTTATPTRNAAMQWNWDAATDLPSDPTLASGIKGYQYRFTTGNTVINDWTDVTTTTVTTTAPYDGFYQLQVRAVDNAGNVSIESVGTAQLDQVPPTVVLNSPTNGTVVGPTKKITFDGSTGDAVSYTLSIGKTGQTPVAFTSGEGFSTYTFDTSTLPNDSYIGTLTGIDAAGNQSTAEVLIIISNNTTTPPVQPAPTITVNAAKYTSRPIVVTGKVSADVTRITITILDAKGKVVETGVVTLTAGKTTWSYTVKANLSNATYTVQARASNTTGSFVDGKANIVVAVQCNWLAILLPFISCWFF